MNGIPSSCKKLNLLTGWEIKREIGRGGSGVVYEIERKSGENNERIESAALKWIHLDGNDLQYINLPFREAQLQLLAEISNMRKLSSTKEIVTIHDDALMTAEDGLSMDAFMMMELLVPLTKRLQSPEGLTVRQSRQLVADIARALNACHAADIIHGDLKPENILCTEDCFKLSDFGVSKQFKNKPGVRAGGTPYFQPPQQTSSAPSTKEGDVYSFGMTLYILFNNGMLPFQKSLLEGAQEEGWKQYCRAYKNQDTIPDPKHATAEIAQVILKAISPRAEERYPTPDALSQAFHNACQSLNENQLQMYLPYYQTTDALSRSDKIYLSTNRLTPGYRERKPQADNTGKGGQKSSDGGFVPPSEEVDPPPEKIDPPPGGGDPPPKKEPFSFKKVLFPLLLLALAGLAGILLLPKHPLDAQITPAHFSADVTVSSGGKPYTITLLAGGSPVGCTYESAADTLRLAPLAPATAYTARIQSGKMEQQSAFRTLQPAQKDLSPLKQRIYVGERSLLQAHAIDTLIADGRLTEVQNTTLTLQNAPLSSQNLALLLCCTAGCTSRTYEASTMVLVLRTPGDVLSAGIEAEAIDLRDQYYCNTTQDASALFEEYFARHGTHAKGNVRLELYWQGELFGMAELTLE